MSSPPNRTQSPNNRTQDNIQMPVATQQISEYITNLTVPKTNLQHQTQHSQPQHHYSLPSQPQTQVIQSSRPPLISPTYMPVESKTFSQPLHEPSKPIGMTAKAQPIPHTFTFTNSQTTSRPNSVIPPVHPVHDNSFNYHNIPPNIPFPPSSKNSPKPLENTLKKVEEPHY